MPGNPRSFSHSQLPVPGAAAFQGEHNKEILKQLHVPEEEICEMQQRNIIVSRP
jgi:CoA:oxalate CoA-transferase